MNYESTVFAVVPNTYLNFFFLFPLPEETIKTFIFFPVQWTVYGRRTGPKFQHSLNYLQLLLSQSAAVYTICVSV